MEGRRPYALFVRSTIEKKQVFRSDLICLSWPFVSFRVAGPVKLAISPLRITCPLFRSTSISACGSTC